MSSKENELNSASGTESVDKPQEPSSQDYTKSAAHAGVAIGIVVTVGALAYFLIHDQLDWH